jgi:hypothetical protein
MTQGVIAIAKLVSRRTKTGIKLDSFRTPAAQKL